MKVWYNNILEARRYVANVSGDRVRIGRQGHNDIVLNSPFVADEAAVLQRRGANWELVALGMNGCEVAGQPVRFGERCPVAAQAPIRIFPFTLTLEGAVDEAPDEQSRHAELERQMAELIRGMHIHLLSVMDLSADDDPRMQSDDYLLSLERNIEEIGRLSGLAERSNQPLVSHLAGYCVRTMLIERTIDRAGKQPVSGLQGDSHWSRLVSAVPDRESELTALADRIGAKLGLGRSQDISAEMDLIESGFWNHWRPADRELFEEFRLYLAQRELKKQLKDIVFGYGPLEDLLRTPTISEIMVVNRDRIYIEKSGVVENSGRQFISDDVTITIIERIVSRVGRRIDKSQPLVDARLIDGSRVNAVIPPLAVSGPCLTIRKFPLHRLTVEELIRFGSLTPTVAEFLRASVTARKNILIAGGTGSGKTTLLNCLSEFIPDKERIVTIEDTAELQLSKEHVVRLETKPANAEGAGAYTIYDLVKNALRMRPDRIVVGECRGREALDMLQAMNTGHDGSMTTIHANSAADVILRLEVMVQSAADLPIDSIHRQIAAAVDLVVQLTRLRDGTRRVTQVTEILPGMTPGEHISTRDLFLYEEQGNEGQLMPTGRLPSFMGELIEKELIDLESFYR